MKKTLLVFVLSAFVAGPAIANPEMDTEQGYCHFALSANNANIEAYVSNCEAVVDDANGNNTDVDSYARAVRVMYHKASPVKPGTTLYITGQNAPNINCQQNVDGDDTTTQNWVSKIQASAVSPGYDAKAKWPGQSLPKNHVRVFYTLRCLNGR